MSRTPRPLRPERKPSIVGTRRCSGALVWPISGLGIVLSQVLSRAPGHQLRTTDVLAHGRLRRLCLTPASPVSARLIDLRKARGLTHTQLADAIDSTRSILYWLPPGRPAHSP